jgi:monoamine oxidase|tara:strand:+ start:126 stop:326 length:201 start_codon:yes stop_codon:yes gene_type:complete
MLAEAKPDIKLATPVSKVVQTDSGVTIHTEEEEIFRARYAIVTLPLNVLKDVDFSPPLHPRKIAGG